MAAFTPVLTRCAVAATSSTQFGTRLLRPPRPGIPNTRNSQLRVRCGATFAIQSQLGRVCRSSSVVAWVEPISAAVRKPPGAQWPAPGGVGRVERLARAGARLANPSSTVANYIRNCAPRCELIQHSGNGPVLRKQHNISPVSGDLLTGLLIVVRNRGCSRTIRGPAPLGSELPEPCAGPHGAAYGRLLQPAPTESRGSPRWPVGRANEAASEPKTRNSK
jgi:hypothetical protein